jgi:hypothetical protein
MLAVMVGLAHAQEGFQITHDVELKTAPHETWDLLLNVQRWWDPENSYSGSAKTMSIDVRPGGCWCEGLPDGGFVEHMRVVHARPRQMLRMVGALGPLQKVSVNGAMEFVLEQKGRGTVVHMTYTVGGYDPEGLARLRAPIDDMLDRAMDRFAEEASSKP